MTFAELEAENDSVRIRDVFDYKYRQGEVLSGKVPLGYSIENKHLAPNQDAGKALHIFQFYPVKFLSDILSKTSTLYLTRTQTRLCASSSFMLNVVL